METFTTKGSDLRALAKVELHRHLDGSVRVETILDLARSQGIKVGPAERLTITSPMEDLAAVLACFGALSAVLGSAEALSRVTFENIEDANRDGVRLLELRFAPPFIAQGKALSNDEIIEGVLDGMARGMAHYPVEVGLIGILPRGAPLEVNRQATRDLVRWRASGAPGADRICGFDLADREAGVDPAIYLPMVEEAREAGMGITIHSGEDTDAAHVARTLDLFKPRRIGHGIRAWGDREVMARLRDNDVLLEVCPTSNWLTRAVPSLASHPLPLLHRAGVPVSINSDDPQLMAIDLVHEYEICRSLYGFTDGELAATNRAAFGHSFLPAAATDRVRDLFFPGGY
jgi:adenosine deaminase